MRRTVSIAICTVALFLAAAAVNAQPAGCRNPTGFNRCVDRCVDRYNIEIGPCDTGLNICMKQCKKLPPYPDAYFCEADCQSEWDECAAPAIQHKQDCETSCDEVWCSPF